MDDIVTKRTDMMDTPQWVTTHEILGFLSDENGSSC